MQIANMFLSLTFICAVVSPLGATPLSDSTTFSASQINKLHSLTAPGQIPIGTVVPWPSDQRIPSPMWLPCNGQNIAPDSPLAKAIGKNSVPDLNGFQNTLDSNGNGFFLRGSVMAGVTQTDTIRRQYHGQDEHVHAVKMEVKNPNVSGTAEGQVYFDWITGVSFAASKNKDELALFKGLNTSKFRKFQYNVQMGDVEGSSSTGHSKAELEEHVAAARAAGYYSSPDDPYFFSSSNIGGGWAFTIPEGPKVSRSISHSKGWVDFNIAHEGYMDESNPRYTVAGTGYTRFLGTISNTTEGGKIQENSGGLVDTTVGGTPGKLPIEYDGDNNYEYTGDAETTPQYKNVVYIIKALP